MFVIVAMHPYEDGEVEGVVGPFATKGEAEENRDTILSNGGHPDADFEIFELQAAEHFFGDEDSEEEFEDD